MNGETKCSMESTASCAWEYHFRGYHLEIASMEGQVKARFCLGVMENIDGVNHRAKPLIV